MSLLRDRKDEFEQAGVQPYAISRDSPWTHVAWIQVLDLNFPLLSDWNGETVRAFGVAQEFRGMQDIAERSAFLVAGGTVRASWRVRTGRGAGPRRAARRSPRAAAGHRRRLLSRQATRFRAQTRQPSDSSGTSSSRRTRSRSTWYTRSTSPIVRS